MKKKAVSRIGKSLAMFLLLSSSLPFSLAYAETVEEVPTSETTISTMADDPLKDKTESTTDHVPTIEESDKEETRTTTSETASTEETKTTESSTADSTKKKPKPKPFGGGIGPQTMNLIEGVDIDANFAQLLRTNKSTTNAGAPWSGFGKAQDQLTDDDMAALNEIKVESKNLASLKGIEYAINLIRLVCYNNQITNLDVSLNTKLTELDCAGNQLPNLDVSANTALISLICGSNQFTSIDVSSNLSLKTLNCSNLQLTSLNLTANVALVNLYCANNQLVNLDITNNPDLTTLYCYNNQLISLDLSGNPEIKEILCYKNLIKSLDISTNTKLDKIDCKENKIDTLIAKDSVSLREIDCSQNNLSNLDISNCKKLVQLECYYNSISSLNVSGNTALKVLSASGNSLTSIDVSTNLNLESFGCNSNTISNLDTSTNSKLVYLYCNDNLLTSLDLSSNQALNTLNCNNNQLTILSTTNNPNLETLYCNNNHLTGLNIDNRTNLRTLECNNNQLTTLNTVGNSNLRTINCDNNRINVLSISDSTKLEELNCNRNQLETLDVSNNIVLRQLRCSENKISDITSANNLNNLTDLNFSSQRIRIPVPSVSSGGNATVDILRTTAQAGLSSSNGNVSPLPSFAYSGNDILLSNVTKASLSDKYINFSYNGSQLVEGAASGSKHFSGTITFFSASDLNNELSANKKKVNSGEEVEWTWKITSISTKRAEDIHATLNLPTGLVINPSSIQKNGSPATISDMDGTNSLGNLSTGQTITFTFKTTASGNAEEWLEAKGRLDWKDDLLTSPYHNEETVGVQILDEEQTYTPKDSNDIALQSVPISFDYGSHHVVSSSAQTHHLGAANYQSNTNVVTDGFYTRVKDDRTTSTGWKLTAKLSEFRDSGNQVMPNGAGTSLKLENMTIERVTDRDTPQEVIDPTPSGADVPSSVTATETLVAGQATAKTLVHAQVNEGRETWQLRMPFDKVSLNVPANAGKKATRYRARLTWSLDDTL